MMTWRLVPWKVWLMWGLLTLLCLGAIVALARTVLAQATPAPCDDVLLTLHRTLADQVQHQLLQELAAARRELAKRPAPTPTAPLPVQPTPTVPSP